MTKRDRQEEALDAGTEAFIDRIDEAYRPPDRTPMQNAAFDQDLQDRIDSPGSGFGVVVWGAAMAAAAAAIITLVIVGRSPMPDAPPSPDLADSRTPVDHVPGIEREIALDPIEAVEIADRSDAASGAAGPSTAEEALMALAFESEEIEDTSPQLTDALPDDYAAIDSLFLGG